MSKRNHRDISGLGSAGATKRTSTTHPLKIAAVSSGPSLGRIGITFRPGKYDPFGWSGAWHRDLASDLDVIRNWGAAAVVTLLEPQEMELLGVENLGEQVRRRNMLWFHLPIIDVSIPDQQFERSWNVAGEELRSMLRRGVDVVVHCRGGLGRAGTIAARLLVELGCQPAKAIAEVRAVRPGAIETDDQEDFVLGLSRIDPVVEPAMDWFEHLTGFRETNYDDTRAKLRIAGSRLQSLVNGKSYSIGELELVSLHELRQRAKSVDKLTGRLNVSIVRGDVRKLHAKPEYAAALFQVASQFNLLEMISDDVTPERGVTCYQDDPTQGPACAIAAGAATIYRNYFVPVGGGNGQTAKRQLDALADLAEALGSALRQPVKALWTMQNGYALCTTAGVDAIANHLATLDSHHLDILRGKLRIGLHRDIEVTDGLEQNRPVVSQAFCSALPISYCHLPVSTNWQPFASLVLEAAYEATLLAAVLNAKRGSSNIVLLTQLGGGAFGNHPDWIYAATRRCLQMMSSFDLDVRLVSYGSPSAAMLELVKEFE
jgi:protein-tyrosine phosphatase